MPNKLSISIIGAMCIFTASAVNAHSPELHKKKNAEKPKCEAMNNMDHSTMDMNDPIMQAMMKQCMGSDNQGGEHQGMEQKNMGSGHGDMHKTDDDHHGEMKKSQ
jgi:hypothetical protein